MAIAGAIMTGAAKDVEQIRSALLAWYDRHRRVLPWRALPGQVTSPYRVWLSEIMLQQTTVNAVVPYFLKFLEKWPTINDLAAAPSEDVMQAWAGLGYYARARNLHKCARYVAHDLGGVFPRTLEGLKLLPGVGDYTSAAIAAIAFNLPANVVDGNVERVAARIFAVEEPLPDCKPTLKRLAAMMAEGETARPGDYAQALMDLGATICTPSSPKCMICPIRDWCDAFAKGIAADLPRRKTKVPKPQRHGYVYWITDPDGRILFERRAEAGLLGGTIGLPTSSWLDRSSEAAHLPFVKNSSPSPVKVFHGFTHFDLELQGRLADWADGDIPAGYFWATTTEAARLGIPTLFKKALKQFI